MRVLSLLLCAPAVLGARLRHKSAATLLATVQSTTATAAEKADCVESAKNGINQVYEDVDEVQKMIDGLPDGTECKLDTTGVEKAKGKVSKLEQDIQGAKTAVEQAESADAPCCELVLSNVVAAKDEGAFPQGLKCTAVTDALKNLDALRSQLSGLESSMPGALEAVTDAKDAADRALNACICKAEDNQIAVYDKAEGTNKEKFAHRSKTIMLNKQVICAQENAGAGGDADKCDSEKLALTEDEKKKLTLTKPKMGAKCIREPEPKICCKALTAECLSCAAGQTIEEFCKSKPETNGCKPPKPEPKPMPKPVIMPVERPMVGGPDEHGCNGSLPPQHATVWNEQQQKCVPVMAPPPTSEITVMKPAPEPAPAMDGLPPPPPPPPMAGPAVGHCGTGGANPNCDGKDSKEACEGASTEAGVCIWTVAV